VDYWVYPWPVEIINEASPWAWLVPVGALIGSALLFVGGLTGIYLTNKAGAARSKSEGEAAEGRAKMEIEATREKDFRNWQRDNLLRLATEISDWGARALSEFNAVAHHHRDPAQVDPSLKQVDEWALKIWANKAGIELVGSDEAATLAEKLFDEVNSEETAKASRTLASIRHGKVVTNEAKAAADTQFTDLWMRLYAAHSGFMKAVQRDIAQMKLPTQQLDHVRRLCHRCNRFGQRVLNFLLGDVVGIGRLGQHVAAVAEPFCDLDEMDACGQPEYRRRMPKVV